MLMEGAILLHLLFIQLLTTTLESYQKILSRYSELIGIRILPLPLCY